jgi:hypothetical protein
MNALPSLRVCGALVGSLTLALSMAPSASHAQALYTLNTTCSLAGAAPQPCTVEAVDQGDFTLYRHRIGGITETIRITDSPARMSRWVESRKDWVPLTTAAARFSNNTICFNGRELCVVNPNYLSSVLEDRPELMKGRDLVKVHFGSDGRVNASCFDAGCEVTLK